MNRKTLLCLALLATAFMTRTQAQSTPGKFYMKVAGGYFFSVSPGQFPDVGPYPPRDEHVAVNPATGATTTISERVLTGSYGEGVRGGLSFGYTLNKYFAIEGTFNYFHSKKNLMTKNVTTVQGTNTVVGSIESHGHVNAIDFAPSLVVSPGYEKFNPYVRFGFVVPLWGKLYIETDATRTSAVPGQPAAVVAQTAIHRKEEIKPNPTFGFQGALGFNYAVARRLDIFAEAEYRNVPVRSKSKEVTEYDEVTRIVNTATGAEVGRQTRNLNDLSTAERETEYVTVLDQNSNTPTGTTGTTTQYKNNDAPANDLKSYINIGGLGLNAGVRFRF
ncbi:outer membrane beta-barrel protein [Chitinophaga sp. GCM10012297]|uniref:Outer membrane beta-barrel protein n=1 Tax=Chitinophaga chungangae TaxID=2821488 RepID=A0ABS3YCE5_9BACT|nr:outer membrane beta-barrel protein [Chitinophaga chungangae]MBO9151809.1 outer membrane beta-barrel protein [Chitinophaga chungangae]